MREDAGDERNEIFRKRKAQNSRQEKIVSKTASLAEMSRNDF